MFRFPFLPPSLLLGQPAMAPELTSLRLDPSGPAVVGGAGKQGTRSNRTTAQDKRTAAKRRAIKRARKLGHA